MRFRKITTFFNIILLFWTISILFFFFISIKFNQICNIQSSICLHLYNHKINLDFNYYNIEFINAFISSIKSTELTYKLNPIYSVLIYLFGFYLILFLINKYLLKKSTLNLKLSIFTLFGIFLFIFNILYLNWIDYYSLWPEIKAASLIINEIKFIFPPVIFILFILGIGKFALKLTKIENISKNLLFLISIAVGFIIIYFFSFFLAFFKLNPPNIIIIVTLLMTMMVYKEIFYWLGYIFKDKISIDEKYFSLKTFFFFSILIILSQFLLDSFRPFPTWHDGLVKYFNIVYQLNQINGLVPDSMPYPIQLIILWLVKITQNPAHAMAVNFSIVVLLALAIYEINNIFEISKKFSLHSVTIFLTMPLISWLSVKDYKIDLYGLFYLFLGTLLIFNSMNNKFKYKLMVYLTMIFFAMGLIIKYSNIFYIIILMFYLLVKIIHKQKKYNSKLLILFIFFLIPLFPTLTYNLNQMIKYRQFSFSNVYYTYYPSTLRDRVSTYPSFTKSEALSKEAIQEDLAFYQNNKPGPLNKLLLPLPVTLGGISSPSYLNIGFIFLIVIPIIYLFYLLIKKPVLIIKEILTLNFIYWVFWLFWSRGIIWYGLSGFILCFILLQSYLKISDKLRRNIFIINIALTLWIIISLFYVTTKFIDLTSNNNENVFRYRFGKYSEEEYKNISYTNYKYVKLINEDNKNSLDNFYYYLTGASLIYFFIDNNIDRAVYDNSLTFFATISDSDNPNITLQRFKELNVKYLILTNLAKKEEYKLFPNYKEKADNIIKFVQQSDKFEIINKDQKNPSVLILKIK